MKQFALSIARMITLLFAVNLLAETNGVANSIGAGLIAIFVLLLEVEV